MSDRLVECRAEFELRPGARCRPRRYAPEIFDICIHGFPGTRSLEQAWPEPDIQPSPIAGRCLGVPSTAVAAAAVRVAQLVGPCATVASCWPGPISNRIAGDRNASIQSSEARLRAPKPRPRRTRGNMRKLGSFRVSVDFLGDDREDRQDPEGCRTQRPFARSEPSVVRPDCPKPHLQVQSRFPCRACGLAIRAGSTRAQSSGTSVRLGAEVSVCSC